MTEVSAPLNKIPNASSERTAHRDAVDAKFNLKPFIPVDDPKEDVKYADLQAIDFGTYVEGISEQAVQSRKKLAAQLYESLQTHGFFFITNHGIDVDTINRLNSITQALNSISDEEKLKYRSAGMTSDEDVNTDGAEKGAGFKPRKYWGLANGVRDNIEFYNVINVVQDEVLANRRHPDVIAAYLNEIANYLRYIHHNVLRRLTVLCDLVLELPEGPLYNNYFKVTQGDVPGSGSGFGRLMSYFGQTDEDNKLTDNTWLRGHSDSTAFTFIASQPMVTLQILNYEDRSWQYVKHVPGALVVNIGDAVEFLTGGYFRSTTGL